MTVSIVSVQALLDELRLTFVHSSLSIIVLPATTTLDEPCSFFGLQLDEVLDNRLLVLRADRSANTPLCKVWSRASDTKGEGRPPSPSL